MTENNRYYICVTPFFPSPTRWQGAYVLDQVKAIQRLSAYKVVVVKTLTLGEEQPDYEIDDITVHTIKPLLMPSYILNGLTEGIVGVLFVRKLQQWGINLKDVAVVHCHTANHSAFGFGVKRVNKDAKVVVQFHDLDPYCLRNGRWADKRWNVRYRARKSLSAFNRADMLVSISKPVEDNLLAFPKARKAEIYKSYLDRLECVKDFPHVKPNATYILNNGVDTALFFKQGKQNDDVFRIGCIANFQELKDHITLIKAFEILIAKGYDDMRLSFLGSGETKSMCEQYIAKHGLKQYVEWVQEMTHDHLPDYYNSLNIFVLPSIYEGFGCVYTEAYACGVPFIGVKEQGAAECIVPEEIDEWLIKPRDFVGLAEKIEQYYLHPKRQHLCKPFDINVLVADFLKEIEKL